MGISAERLSTENHWSLWSGTSTDFRAILRTLSEHVTPLMPDYVADKTASQRRDVEYYTERHRKFSAIRDADPSDALARAQLDASEEALHQAQAHLDRAVADAALAGRLQVTVESKRGEQRQASGTPEEVSEFLDERSWSEVSLDAPGRSLGTHRIRLVCHESAGVSLFVSSDDTQWALAASSDLTSVIANQVPSWRFLRLLWFRFVFCFAVTFTTLWFLFDAFGDAVFGDGVSVPWLQLTYYAVSPGIALLLFSLSTRLVPAFQILRPGERSRAKAMFAFLGTSLASIPFGAVVNWVT